VPKIELLLRSRLVKEALSAVLMKAEFAIFHEPTENDSGTVVIIDFDDCKDPEFVRAHGSRGVKIVALTSEADSREIGFDEIAPLSGILTYDLSADTFVRSLLLISSGERVFPNNLALGRKSAAAAFDRQSNDAHLSPREKGILSLLVAGHPNKLIARHLGIAEATVKVHLKSVQRKIRVENRTQAAIWALANLPELGPPSRGFACAPKSALGRLPFVSATGSPPSPADSLRHRPLPARLLPLLRPVWRQLALPARKTTHQRL
jgi:two-component system, NarL family, nitrate/nitrite response regulator NarL